MSSARLVRGECIPDDSERTAGEPRVMRDGASLVLATRNSGKLRELAPLIEQAGFVPLTLDDVGVPEQSAEDSLEAFETFAENAVAKAAYFYERCGGLPVLAEDSGLCITALGGAPGVHSKRWGGESGLSGAALDRHNVDRVLSALAGVTDRTAHYACAAVVVWPGGQVSAEGQTVGRLLEGRSGEGGFGYDPIFWSDDLAASFGVSAPEEKARVSHRSRAVRAVLARYVEASGADLAEGS